MLANTIFILVICCSISCAQRPKVDWSDQNWANGCEFHRNSNIWPIIEQVDTEPEKCGPVCDTKAECSHFNWRPAQNENTGRGGTCVLMRGRVSKSEAVPASSYAFVCGVSLSANIRWNNGNWATGCEFDGDDFGQASPIASAECGPRCELESGCSHFSWSKNGGGTCLFKSGIASKLKAFAVEDKEAVCGVIATPKPTDAPSFIWPKTQNWATGCDFMGGDFMQLYVPGEKCGPSCDSDRVCTHFAWSQQNGGTCRLKHSSSEISAIKRTAIAVRDPTAVCGLKINFIDWSNGDWAVNCDFSQYDQQNSAIGNQMITAGADQCRQSCIKSRYCSHYTWTQADKNCRLSRGRHVTKANAVLIKSSGVTASVCGFVRCSGGSALRAAVGFVLFMTPAVYLVLLLFKFLATMRLNKFYKL